MLFNWLQKKNENPQKSLATISYVIKSDKSGPFIDIELMDYDDASAEALCEILDILANESAYIQTINMLKTFLLKDGQDELLIKIFSTINSAAREKIIQSQKSQQYDEPCIKPSDMI